MTSEPAPEAPAILMTNVVRRYGTTVALADLSLSVARGEMFGLIGPDGAGKTTAIRLICGLLHPHAGGIRVLARDPVREHRASRLVLQHDPVLGRGLDRLARPGGEARGTAWLI